MIWLYVSAGFIAATAGLLLTSISLNPHLTVEKNEAKIVFALFFGTLKLFSFHFVIRRKAPGEYTIIIFNRKDEAGEERSLFEYLQSFQREKGGTKKDFRYVLGYFYQKAKLQALKLQAEVGTADAAATALWTGFVKNAVNALLSIVYNAKGLPETYDIKVFPVYYRNHFRLDFQGTLTVRCWHALKVSRQIYDLTRKPKT